MSTLPRLVSAGGLLAALAWAPGAAAMPLADVHAPHAPAPAAQGGSRPVEMPEVRPDGPAPVPFQRWRTEHLPRPVPLPEASTKQLLPGLPPAGCVGPAVGSPRLQVTCLPGPVPPQAR
ncbi:hypothetical protein QWY28_08865 [Nocardioides sp. SOB77]|uniref:Uncharacterized protein n=1 Tax=Nocardioides oceani TaxID=3058369 RepID=A0ABT8FES9_9ACTN|nr:hypothetical protein [Nocardioides oceani]MDN4173050.1 hypothetical protein [Nocardioides oceani]